MSVGIHLNKDMINMIYEKTNINCFQIFLDDIKHILKNDDEIEKFCEITKNKKIFCHSSLKINIANSWTPQSWWLQHLIKSIKICNKLKIYGIVIHFGYQLQQTYENAINNMFSCLIYVLQQTYKYKHVKILLETSSGQASEMCSQISDLINFYHKFQNINKFKNRVQICIDTCHIFAAGYDIHYKTEFKQYMKILLQHIALKNIGLIHLNDSYHKVNSRIDRHQNFDQGYIGKQTIKYIFNYFYKNNIPIILETPQKTRLDDLHYLFNQ